jgi:hypothetical protein
VSRGLGRLQRELLARVKRLKPGEQFLLADVAGDHATADQWDSRRRAARLLERAGYLRLDGERRGLVVRPALDGQKSDTSKLAKARVPDTYRDPGWR